MFNKIRHNNLIRIVSPFIDNKTSAIIPDSQKLNSAFIIVEDGSDQGIKAIEDQMASLFSSAQCHFIILYQNISDVLVQDDKYCEVKTRDFDFWGLLKPDKQTFLSQLPPCDMLINLTDSNHKTGDYISTILKANFRVGFHKDSFSKIYDLILDVGLGSDAKTKINMLHNYLNALNGESK